VILMDFINDEYEMILKKTLPVFLENDIRALEEGIKNNSSIMDCLYCEVQGSINLALYNNEITEHEAKILRTRYLGL